MLRLRDEKLVWGERDVIAMSRIVGTEEAIKQRAPYLPVILKAAADSGRIILSRKAHRALRLEKRKVRTARRILRRTDAKPTHPLEERMMPHQRVAMRFFRVMLKKYGIKSFLIADKTGVGKTLQALLWAKLVMRARNVLIITPNGAKRQWRDAIKYWIGEDERVTIVEGSIPEQQDRARRTNRWVIGHWESLGHKTSEAYLEREWDVVIFDEGHKITNRKSNRSEHAYQLDTNAVALLTAHPFDEVDDLYGELRALFPDRYTSYWRFFNIHAEAYPKPFGGFVVEGIRKPKLLRWELAPFTMMRTKQQVYKDLPPVARRRRLVELTRTGEREYKELRRKLFAELDGLNGETKIIPIINDLVRLTRVRQYLVDPGLIGSSTPSVKYPEMVEVLDEFYEPTVIFTSFQKAAVRLEQFLNTKAKKFGARIDGTVSLHRRDVYKKRFLRGDLAFLIVQSASGGESLNYGKYGYVASLDLPFSPRMYEQTEGRVDRPEENTGKLVPTTAARIIVKGSYEERLEQKLNRMDDNFRSVFTVKGLRRLFAA